ncbi:MAG: 16S rRNA (cytosine(1402)-N(4))-methyltransferase RsmH [Desulfobacteraceae bacterium]|nr:16S rRNA (cytosine(1402)-N(4))-methyltransferase RsmH [Desulfobacteraceae bacterium]
MMYHHTPVMLDEIIAYLNCKPGKRYVDCTLGGAGHSSAILEKILPDGLLIGIDQDADAITNAERLLKPYGSNVRLFHENYVHLPDILSQLNLLKVDGIIADLGLSLHQIESSGRGFSFQKSEPLDMRMNAASGITAEDIVNFETQAQLETIFRDYGEERWARKIAQRMIAVRAERKIRTSQELVKIVCDAIPGRSLHQRKKHPATKVFMALRIAVNRELEVLESFMDGVLDLLNPGGRICFLTFHSLEDRIVKRRFKAWEGNCTCPPDFPECVCHPKKSVKILTRKAVRPTPSEVAGNPMARSACLRVAEKI